MSSKGCMLRIKLFTVIEGFYFSIMRNIFKRIFGETKVNSPQTLDDNKDMIPFMSFDSISAIMERDTFEFWVDNHFCLLHSHGLNDPTMSLLLKHKKRNKNSYTRIFQSPWRWSGSSFIIVQLFDRTNDIIIYFYWITLTLSNFPNDFVSLPFRCENIRRWESESDA